MSIAPESKTKVIETYRRTDSDTGSPEVQIAVLTQRIDNLTEHLKSHMKDHASRRGLLMLVSQRRRLLNYLKRNEEERYKSMIDRLNLRK